MKRNNNSVWMMVSVLATMSLPIMARQGETGGARRDREIARLQELYNLGCISQSVLDRAIAKQSEAQAAETLQAARADTERMQQLYQSGAVSVAEVEAARQNVTRASINQAVTQLNSRRRDAERTRLLYRAGMIAYSVLARKEAALKQAQDQAATALVRGKNANLDQARTVLERMRMMYQQGLVTRSAVEDAEAAYQAALKTDK